MAVTADKPAPYAPGKTVLDIIDRYRHRGLPSPVTGEVLGRAGVPDSLLPRTLQALVTLDLIDGDGQPTATFENIRLAPEAEYKKRLEDWLKGTYADVFSFVDPSKDDETRIRDAFRSYQPIGQQPRMVTLFQALCAAAGLTPEKASATGPAARPRPANPPQAKRPPSKSQRPTHHAVAPASHANTGPLPPALSGLLASLPAQGSTWTKAEREAFMTTFGAVLDFCFPPSEALRHRQHDDEEEPA